MPEQDGADRDPEAEPTAIDVLTGEQIHGDAGPAEAIPKSDHADRPEDELPVSSGVSIDPATGVVMKDNDFHDVPTDGQEPSAIDEAIAETPDTSQQHERDFWWSRIEEEAIRAGINPSGTVGCTTLHLIGDLASRARDEAFAPQPPAVDDPPVPADPVDPIDEVEFLLSAVLSKLAILRKERPDVRVIQTAYATAVQARTYICEAKR